MKAIVSGIASLLRWTMDIILNWALIFWCCFVSNIIGAIGGAIFWYGPMLMDAPLWALPFIPDCPLSALLGSIGLFALRQRKRWHTFYAFVAFACMKYGVWTVLFWLRQWVGSGIIEPLEVLLFVVHIGLFIEGLLFVPRIGAIPFIHRLLIIGWFALSIYVDYGLGYDPGMVSHVPLRFAFWVATSATIVLGLGLLLLPYRKDESCYGTV